MNRAQQRQESAGGFLGVLLAANPEIAQIVGVRSRAVVRRTWHSWWRAFDTRFGSRALELGLEAGGAQRALSP